MLLSGGEWRRGFGFVASQPPHQACHVPAFIRGTPLLPRRGSAGRRRVLTWRPRAARRGRVSRDPARRRRSHRRHSFMECACVHACRRRGAAAELRPGRPGPHVYICRSPTTRSSHARPRSGPGAGSCAAVNLTFEVYQVGLRGPGRPPPATCGSVHPSTFLFPSPAPVAFLACSAPPPAPWPSPRSSTPCRACFPAGSAGRGMRGGPGAATPGR